MRDRPRLLDDPYLAPFLPIIEKRRQAALLCERRLTGQGMNLADFAGGHEYFGLHQRDARWVFTEWAPNALAMYLIGDFSNWCESPDYALHRINETGTWQVALPIKTLKHGDLYRLRIHWEGGVGDRLPAYSRYVIQDDKTKAFNAVVWSPPTYCWRKPDYVRLGPRGRSTRSSAARPARSSGRT